jgi:zinc transport system ATP-binding protein
MKKQLVVECSQVSFAYKSFVVLKNINLSLYKSSITTIIGPNGGGKTTLGKIIAGSLKPTSGTVYRDKKLSVGYMPQKIYLNHLMPMTSLQFICLSLNPEINVDKFKKGSMWSNIEILLHKQMHTLSSGELQKVLFARLMVSNPDIMILDEPTEGLDAIGQQEFYATLDKICHEQKKTILLISHDLHTVMSGSNYVFCLDKAICCSGLPETVSKNEHYERMFRHKTAGVVSYYQHDHK